jgi:hypothetical protein
MKTISITFSKYSHGPMLVMEALVNNSAVKLKNVTEYKETFTATFEGHEAILKAVHQFISLNLEE